MERIDRLNAIGMKLIGASEELKTFTKEIAKGCDEIAFGTYRGQLNITTADEIEIKLSEAKFRIEYIQKLLDKLRNESGIEITEQMAFDEEEE